ncbi:agglutinin-1-like [Daucus carota subsp. sativus]|uniref:agglutinin-1-like n=1 Tax=Daucus carota subsp. sativus TaxID=79200 RepID=UPI003082D2AF
MFCRELSRLLLFAAAAWLASCIICVHGHQSKYYCAMPFYTRGANQTTYADFIHNLRDEMGSQSTIYGIPQLQDAASLANEDRYVEVTLYSSTGTSITVAIDKVNAYVIGYQNGYDAYFFPGQDVPETSNVFVGATRCLLPFNSSYSALEKSAGTTRGSTKLGIGELDKAIQALYDKKEDSALACSMLIVIQMISDAVRSRYVEKLILQHISNDNSTSVFLPTPAMIAFQDEWKNLSSKITYSVGGVIYPPFILPTGSNQKVSVTSVFITFRLNIGVILFYCHPATAVPTPHSVTCQNIPEPTVLISGRNGYCADVESNFYRNGDAIILYPCKSTKNAGAANQLWTIKRDGSIQCRKKCLNAKALTAGKNRIIPRKNMTIYNCSTAEPDSIKWNINDNGNIENPKSGLAVSGFKGKTFSPLTVEKNTYASSQGWRLSNNTMPVVTPIIGFESLCMQACGGNTVEMLECSNTTAQKWKLYPDGTVRPYSATSNCLTSKSSQDVKTLVRAMEVMLNDGYSITIIAFLTQLKNLCWKLINRRR